MTSRNPAAAVLKNPPTHQPTHPPTHSDSKNRSHHTRVRVHIGKRTPVHEDRGGHLRRRSSKNQASEPISISTKTDRHKYLAESWRHVRTFSLFGPGLGQWRRGQGGAGAGRGEGGREAQGLGLARVVAVVLWGRLGFVRCGGAQCLVLGGFCYLVASPCCVAVLVVGVDVASAVLE